MMSVTVSTGSRLHFGLLAHRPESGREFGGVGVMIDSPGWTVQMQVRPGYPGNTVEVAPQAASVSPEAEQRVHSVIGRCKQSSPDLGRPVLVRVESAIPSHHGLGSGTQLALAVTRCLDVVLCDGKRTVDELARMSGRGQRSAVGTWGFKHGGCIFEGGRSANDPVGRFISQVHIPADWRFLLITPNGHTGLSGVDEKSAFDQLPGMSTEMTGELCRIAAMELLPSIQAGDFNATANSIGRYGHLAGEYFVPIQKGVFLHPAMNDLSVQFRDAGINGFAQTSWGPTCFVLCRNEAMASEVRDLARKSLPETELQIETVAPRNTGASQVVE